MTDNTDAEILHIISDKIAVFHDKCEAAEYTDVGEVWDLLNCIRFDCDEAMQHIKQDEVRQADTLAELVSVPIDAYSREGDARKLKFHHRAARQLKRLAKVIGLEGSEYDIRSNKGGIAVPGEITLHTDSLYVQVSQSCLGPGHEIMFRTCDGRKDYGGSTSGHNHFAPAGRLDDVPDFAEGLRRAGVI
jgi:hypothetical protein